MKKSFFEETPAAPKICGIRREKDALNAIAWGAGALGFNFYPPSPRSMPYDADLAWVTKLHEEYPSVALVAVVVNPDVALLKRLREARCFDAIQFHGDESAEVCAHEGKDFSYWIKALRIRSREDLAFAAEFTTSFLLLDAAVAGSYGGSGQQIDWGLAAEFIAAHPERRVILAGGLIPENVASAVTQVRPHAVDVASGVESAPGIKDEQRVRQFIQAARQEV